MVRFNCEEVETLPSMTVRASYHTALEFRCRFLFTRFELEFDDSVPQDVLHVSSDLYTELRALISDIDSKHEIDV